MNQEENELAFAEFLASRLRDKGLSLKRLSEATGIAPSHLENLFHGNFEQMPSTPYFRGYLIRIGKALDFDGEEWWNRIKKQEGFVKNSGPSDALPRNRFVKKEIPKSLWVLGVAVILIIIYLVITFPRIIGKPTLTVAFPAQSPYTTALTTIVIQGIVQNADALYVNGTEEITIAPDGSWEKSVLLSQTEPNMFVFSAKKFLGGETDVTEEIISAATASSSATSTQLFPTIHQEPNIPATGSYYD